MHQLGGGQCVGTDECVYTTDFQSYNTPPLEQVGPPGRHGCMLMPGVVIQKNCFEKKVLKGKV